MRHCEDLQAVITPMPVEQFVTDCWEKQSLFIPRATAGLFDPLFRLEDLDRLINLSFTNYSIFTFEGRRVITPRLRRPNKTSLPEFYQAFSAGQTLAVREMQVRWKPIAKLVSTLSRQSGFNFVADVVAAPAGSRNAGLFAGSRSVFILQLSGTSTWELPPGLFRPFETGAAAGAHEGRLTVSAGDTLYLPYGNAPEGASLKAPLPLVEVGPEAPALYLVLSVQRVTWADLLERNVELASARNLELRRALGFGAPLRLFGAAQTQARFRDLLGKAFDAPDWRAASHTLACEHQRRLPHLPDGHFDQLRNVDQVTLDTVVARRPGVEARVQLFDRIVELLVPGSFYQGPEKLFLALDFISETRQFRVRDIPGWYTDAERVLLTKQFMSMGVLTFAHPPETSGEALPG
ncbi:hypothetical protein D7V97_20080 [Corallococcus sp. CA053C]|uniref:cupin domain-containing protein n=1 Tax=Corallococcus sp. CA053C TaxID=2316732 RepID=UPI000EA3B840|nr:cupin domain-containing protein [Corallococcus sp. CA053C]RKH08227.1 hypothetical protein D7V97_20080 [Corallococcus sp. CA053C]